MQIRRMLIVSLILSLSLVSCEKAKPYVEKLKGALKRDAEPQQVVGLAESEKSKPPPPPPEPVKMMPVINKKARVAILGYHDFTESRRPSDMIIHIDDFRDQMKAIKDSGMPVISMRQFLDWKQGKKNIPPESVLITIDDGWKDTHTLAMPVLREFGFPFSAFLYQKYVGIGGRSMTHQEVHELIEAGGTICSHSVSHKNMKRPPGKNDEEKIKWINDELGESHFFLEKHFSHGVIKTFAYPFGFYNDQVVELAREFGYEACFTVSPAKVTWETDDMKLSRYIILGKSPKTFEAAISFGGNGTTSTGRKLLSKQRNSETGEIKKPLIEVYPPSGSTVKNRLPRIEVNLSALKDVQTESVAMRISGLGMVPHRYDANSKRVSYQIPQRLRLDQCDVQVSFRHAGNRSKEIIGWNFKVDKTADYLNPDATFIRSPNQAVNPKEDLLQPEDKEIKEVKSENKPIEAKPPPRKDLSPADLIDPDISSI